MTTEPVVVRQCAVTERFIPQPTLMTVLTKRRCVRSAERVLGASTDTSSTELICQRGTRRCPDHCCTGSYCAARRTSNYIRTLLFPWFSFFITISSSSRGQPHLMDCRSPMRYQRPLGTCSVEFCPVGRSARSVKHLWGSFTNDLRESAGTSPRASQSLIPQKCCYNYTKISSCSLNDGIVHPQAP